MKRIVSIAIVAAIALTVAGCGGRHRNVEAKYYKDGASVDDYLASVYVCERDTRMAIPAAFGKSVYSQLEGASFFRRCMGKEGWEYR